MDTNQLITIVYNNFAPLISPLGKFFTDLNFNFFSQLALVILAIVSSLLILLALSKLWIIRYKLRLPYTIFEIQPLRNTEQSAFTTQQFFALIHGLSRQQSFIERFLGITKNYSFEIVSSKEQGIRYLIRFPQEDAALLKQSLLSYLPGLSIKQVSDYYSTVQQLHKLTEFKLANHFAFPLQNQSKLEQHDPIAYTTGSMTKLKTNELMAFQIVASPLKKSTIPDIKRITQLIYTNTDLLSNINTSSGDSWFKSLMTRTLLLLLQILMLPIGLLVFIATGGREGPLLTNYLQTSSKKSDNPYQMELETLIKEKLDQQLFTTSLRLLTIAQSKKEIGKRERGFISALSSFSNSNYQFIVPIKNVRLKLWQSLQLCTFKHRLLRLFSTSILSTSEMADIYHLPFTSTTKTEDLLKQHSKELPAPLSLKRATKLDITFAQNTYGDSVTDIGLTEDERRRHIYILGATGTGKSTMLLSMINQDIQNGKGIAVVDPHGDLIEQILHVIPEERIKDVVYFNPDDIAYPMGINLLELSTGLSDEDALREREYITESIISLFHKIYTEKYSGPRMEYILRNTIHTAFHVKGATLFTVYKLLINTPFRKSVVKTLTDENLKEFWKYEFAKAGDYQKVKMISPITNKIGRFLFSPVAKRILEQETSTINFEQIMNEGKILICNLSKGKLGEDTSKVFGVVVMAKLQLAALKRAIMNPEERKDFYLYVDEFQNFATPAFAQILSEARKYRLAAILAHQTTSQLEDRSLVNITLANTGTVICFRTANPEDETLILPQFRPCVEQGDIASLPSYRFFMRLGALNPEEPFSGVTMPVEIKEDSLRVQQVVENSRQFFAKKYEQPKQTNTILQYPTKKKTQSTGVVLSPLP
ncbi:MAG: type IV secretion system DNA-binding domain-containing protein [Patescibacteria group bacterium]